MNSSNITYKTGMGNYSYGSQPNAVAGTAAGSYSYDANGNMLSGAGRSYNWTSFNLPKTINQGSATADFLYGASHERVRQVASSSRKLPPFRDKS